jgi:hypothetical protein
MMVMFHDDDCGELLDGDGECPKCKFHPDGQSVAFQEVDDVLLRDGIERVGRTYLGKYRERINRAVQVTPPPPEPTFEEPKLAEVIPLPTPQAPPPPAPPDDEEAELLKVQEDVYKEFKRRLTEVTGDIMTRYTEGSFARAATMMAVLHATLAEEVGRAEKILEGALHRAGAPVPNLLATRTLRIERGRKMAR